MREREDHMEGGDVEGLRFTGGQPRRLGAPLALGAMPVATGGIGNLGVVTVVARPLVASEGRRPAGRDGPQGPPLLGAKLLGEGPKMLGKISDTVQRRAHGVRRVVPELQVFPQALAEWGHGLAPRRHTSTPSGQKGEHGGVTRVSHHPRRSHCGPDSGPRRDAGHEGGDGQTGGRPEGLITRTQ
jgi:hypothetical protein